MASVPALLLGELFKCFYPRWGPKGFLQVTACRTGAGLCREVPRSCRLPLGARDPMGRRGKGTVGYYEVPADQPGGYVSFRVWHSHPRFPWPGLDPFPRVLPTVGFVQMRAPG